MHITETPFRFSTNTKRVFDKVVGTITAISLEDIKSNKVVGRHGLMLSLLRAGHCPLAEEYMSARQVKHDAKKALRDEHKGLSTYTLHEHIFDSKASAHTFEKTGWVIAG